MLRRLFATLTILTVMGTFVPTMTASSLTSHCPPPHGGVSLGPSSGMDCDGMPGGVRCATDGCFATSVALTAPPIIDTFSFAGRVTVLAVTPQHTDRLSAGPPTPPPNS